MEDMHNVQPSKLCKEFARILGATPSVINGVCTATKSRTNIHPVLLGRKAESFMFVPQAFSFENLDSAGKALCLGETVILEEEVNPFISRLRDDGIIVTALHNHWLFENPRLMYIHFQDIDEPLSFARKVRRALRVLTNKEVGTHGHWTPEHKKAEELCEQFHNILGGMHTFENGVCMVMDSRLNIMPRVMGRRGRSFLLIPQMFVFESLTPDGKALCSGESVILQEEFNPLASKLREENMFITAFHNHWLFEDPRLMYIHFVKIDQPIQFANDVKKAFEVLTDKVVRS
nr:LppY/LpqO family protein [Lysinibacillus timonensis]